MTGIKSTVSIALCTYNGEKFIERQIDSYLNQTTLPDEIVICDDGSRDGTMSLLQQFMGKNPGIRWHIVQNQKQLGTSMNFEQAICFCHGEIIFLSDQDDVWKQEKIEITLNEFYENPDIDAFFSNAEIIDEQDRKLPGNLLDNTVFKSAIRENYKKGDLLYWSILFGNFISGATMAFRRAALKKIIPFHLKIERKLWHDGWIGLSLMAENRVRYINQNLMQYRSHAGQQVGVVVRNDPFERYIIYDEFDQEFVREYFQRYLNAFSVMKKLKQIRSLDPVVAERVTREYLDHRKRYFDSQSLIIRKIRLLKWYVFRVNHISFEDLIHL